MIRKPWEPGIGTCRFLAAQREAFEKSLLGFGGWGLGAQWAKGGRLQLGALLGVPDKLPFQRIWTSATNEVAAGNASTWPWLPEAGNAESSCGQVVSLWPGRELPCKAAARLLLTAHTSPPPASVTCISVRIFPTSCPADFSLTQFLLESLHCQKVTCQETGGSGSQHLSVGGEDTTLPTTSWAKLLDNRN